MLVKMETGGSGGSAELVVETIPQSAHSSNYDTGVKAEDIYMFYMYSDSPSADGHYAATIDENGQFANVNTQNYTENFQAYIGANGNIWISSVAGSIQASNYIFCYVKK